MNGINGLLESQAAKSHNWRLLATRSWCYCVLWALLIVHYQEGRSLPVGSKVS